MKPTWHWSNQSPEKVKEILNKISVSRKGQHSSPDTQFKKGRISAWKGKRIAWVGHSTPHSEETKLLLAERTRTLWSEGRGRPNFKKGHTPWNKGTHGKMPTPTNKGQGVGASLGLAIRGLPEYTNWRLTVFTRDSFTCQHCGAKGVQLHADHIKPFALICRENNVDSKESALSCKVLWSTKNGQTLCIPCHRKTETYSGKQQTKLYQFPRS